MDDGKTKKWLVILVLAFVGWALCGSIIGVGRGVTSMENTLIIHAVFAPIIFAAISLIYFKKFDYTTPVQTATVFVLFIVFMDVFVVALLVEKSFGMFTSIIGIWLPWALIFASTYLTGVKVSERR